MMTATLSTPPDLAQAYAVCRAIAKSRAKNFYYGFAALSSEQHDAICAIYAFMRKADDLADDEAIALEERRRLLCDWTSAWRNVCQGGPTSDPVFVAVQDAMRRFAIPQALLDELVAGVTRDLEPPPSDQPVTYATFEELYGYCYQVASVVGLVCIRIFGYQNPAAEKLAEETGIAFQLTNILRDVAEDAGYHRVYLPVADLQTHGLTVDGLIGRKAGSPPSAAERALLADLAARAEIYYESARRLLPLIDARSRPALWAMVAIYQGLLKRIVAADYDVFSRRLSVPTSQKLGILAVGRVRMMAGRFSA